MARAGTPSASGRPRAAHLGPERRRPLVLDAALRVLAREGDRGVSIDMIAREAGVTAPVLYECFPSKGALLRALLEREEGRLREQLAASLALDTDRADFRAILEAGFRAYLEAVVALPDSWRVVVHPHLSASPEAIEAVENARAGYVDGVRQVVERALRTQGVTLEDAAAHAVAVALVGTGEALARLLLDAPDRYAPAPLAALAADAFSGLPATVAADS